jgi:hypothetical protein
MDRNALTICTLERVAKDMEKMDSETLSSFRLDDRLGGSSNVIHQASLKLIYGKEASSIIIKGLKHRPYTTIPIVLQRLKQKQYEWSDARAMFNNHWEETIRNFRLDEMNSEQEKNTGSQAENTFVNAFLDSEVSVDGTKTTNAASPAASADSDNKNNTNNHGLAVMELVQDGPNPDNDPNVKDSTENTFVNAVWDPEVSVDGTKTNNAATASPAASADSDNNMYNHEVTVMEVVHDDTNPDDNNPNGKDSIENTIVNAFLDSEVSVDGTNTNAATASPATSTDSDNKNNTNNHGLTVMELVQDGPNPDNDPNVKDSTENTFVNAVWDPEVSVDGTKTNNAATASPAASADSDNNMYNHEVTVMEVVHDDTNPDDNNPNGKDSIENTIVYAFLDSEVSMDGTNTNAATASPAASTDSDNNTYNHGLTVMEEVQDGPNPDNVPIINDTIVNFIRSLLFFNS